MSVQATFTATLVDEWAYCGVTDAVVCPGSRSTPLAIALAERLRVHVRLDERSAAFYALGLAMASGRPVVICTTSGTAAAELHPAVVEAHHNRVPLIVCTADRPPELHHVGAPQTIGQSALFGAATRWTCEPGVAEVSASDTWRPLAARAFAEACRGPLGPGPVHLNLAFREPLVGQPDALPARHGATIAAGPLSVPAGDTSVLTGRGLLIVGGRANIRPEAIVALGDALGWPVLADPRSGCRVPGTIAAADAIVRGEIEQPDTVALLGAPWISKALGEFVATSGARVIAVDPWWQWVDPSSVVSEVHRADPDAWVAAALANAIPCEPAWLSTWRRAEAAAQEAIESTLGTALTEPMVARIVAAEAGRTAATIMVSASMPLRDLEWFAPVMPEPARVLANRGANGIDGVVSTAMGIAATGCRTFALLGDLAFLHDVSGLVNLADVPCTFVVLDNGGGGIFSFLPQATSLDPQRFEQLFGTPSTSDVGSVARGFGLSVVDVGTLHELERALRVPPPVLVRARVPGRAENPSLHDAVNQAVRRAIA